jgi:hypothetical protein
MRRIVKRITGIVLGMDVADGDVFCGGCGVPVGEAFVGGAGGVFPG